MTHKNQHISYGFPILETSATVLCAITGLRWCSFRIHTPVGTFWYVMIFVEFCAGPCSPAWEPEIQSNTYNSQFQNELSIFRIVIHSNIWSISKPNSMTDLLNQVPGTPLHSSCKPGSNWTSQEHNWCQVPWCYAPLLHGQTLGLWTVMFPSRHSTAYNCILFFRLAGVSSFHLYSCYKVEHLTQITWPRFTPAVRRLLQHISLRAPWRPSTAPRQKIISSSRMLKAEMNIHWRRVQHLFNTCLHFPLFLPCLCMFLSCFRSWRVVH